MQSITERRTIANPPYHEDIAQRVAKTGRFITGTAFPYRASTSRIEFGHPSGDRKIWLAGRLHRARKR